jgi:hypothetical protein
MYIICVLCSAKVRSQDDGSCMQCIGVEKGGAGTYGLDSPPESGRKNAAVYLSQTQTFL